jgi:hypothetical protein
MSQDNVEKEVAYLFKKNNNKPMSTFTMVEELKTRGISDTKIMDEVMTNLQSKFKRCKKLAEKISFRLSEKYPDYTKKEYLEKINEYKTKFGFDDSEMQCIVNEIFKKDDNMLPATHIEYSTMSRALGFIPTTHNFIGRLTVDGDEREKVNLIKGIYDQTKDLNNKVTLQSLMYDEEQKYYQGTFDRNKIDMFSHVHPVLFAMFFNKIQLFDETMLLASIPRIVSIRDQGGDLTTQPDYELYTAIATDPNEVHCVSSKSKPFEDLLNRSNVQVQVWNNVMNLRQGKYFNPSVETLMVALDKCKSNVFDAGDLAYVKDEGTVMRKLMGVFSMRPTFVFTMPIIGLSTDNIAPLITRQVSRVPMVQLRFNFNNVLDKTKTYELKSALSSEQVYINNRRIVTKKQEVAYSHGVLIFYVNRRHADLSITNMITQYSIVKLPLAVNSYQKLYNAEVDFDMSIINGSQQFKLNSIVCVDARKITDLSDDAVILGSMAINIDVDSNWTVYKPVDLNYHNEDKLYTRNTGDDSFVGTYLSMPIPMNTIDVLTSAENGSDINSLIKTQGTLFIYVVVK